MSEIIPAKGNLTVLVATNELVVTANGYEPPYAVIMPDFNNWNDHGRRYFAHLLIHGVGQPAELFPLGLWFEGEARTYTALSELLQIHGNCFPIEKIENPFVTLLRYEEHYEEFVRAFGFENAIPGLRKLHDAVVARVEQTDQKLLTMVSDEEFHIGILRYPGAREALRRGGRHFRRVLPAVIEDAAAEFNFSTKLPNTDDEVTLKFDFVQEAPFRNRIAVLIGENGVGKTRLLKAMVDSLTAGAADEGQAYLPRFEPHQTPNRVLVFSSVPSDPYPAQLGAWKGIDYEYFALNSGKAESHDSLLSSLVALRFELLRPIGDVAQAGLNREAAIEAALGRIGLWDKLCLPLRPQKDGDSYIATVDVGERSFLPITQKMGDEDTLKAAQRIDWTRQPVILDDHGRIRQLSSGEYSMLRFASQACIAIEQGSLLLLDEPETHLHPNYISDMMEILYRLLKASRSVAIIATHSAYVVREVSRGAVQVLSSENRHLYADHPRLQTFGASIDSISQFIFNDTDIDHHFQETILEWIGSLPPDTTIDQVIEVYGEELNTETLAFIARELNRQPKLV